MRAAIRFLWRQYAPASAVFLLYALLMTLFRSCSSAGPAGSPLGTYYYMFPIVPALFLLVFNFGVHSTFLDIALSMGCTRRDFLWGHQLLMVLLTLGLSALTALFLFVPGLLGLPEADFMAPAGLVYLVPFTLATAEAASAGGTLRRTHPPALSGFLRPLSVGAHRPGRAGAGGRRPLAVGRSGLDSDSGQRNPGHLMPGRVRLWHPPGCCEVSEYVDHPFSPL